jgi:regulator of replication initiation timing
VNYFSAVGFIIIQNFADMNRCNVCRGGVPDEDGIICSKCSKLFDYKCAGIGESNFKNMLKMNKLKWRCQSCKKGHSPLSSPVRKNPPTLGEVFSLLVSLQTEVVEMRNKMNIVLEKQSGELVELRTSINILTTKVSGISEEYDNVVSKLNLVNAENKKLKTSINKIEQTLLETSVEVQGVMIEEGADAQPMVEALLTAIGCPEAANDVQQISVNNNNRRKNSSVTIRFSSRVIRDKVLSRRKSVGALEAKDLKCEGGKVFINEKLTMYNKHLLWLTKTTKSMGYKFAWTKNGIVYLRKEEGTKPIIIRDVEDIPSR